MTDLVRGLVKDSGPPLSSDGIENIAQCERRRDALEFKTWGFHLQVVCEYITSHVGKRIESSGVDISIGSDYLGC